MSQLATKQFLNKLRGLQDPKGSCLLVRRSSKRPQVRPNVPGRPPDSVDRDEFGELEGKVHAVPPIFEINCASNRGNATGVNLGRG